MTYLNLPHELTDAWLPALANDMSCDPVDRSFERGKMLALSPQALARSLMDDTGDGALFIFRLALLQGVDERDLAFTARDQERGASADAAQVEKIELSIQDYRSINESLIYADKLTHLANYFGFWKKNKDFSVANFDKSDALASDPRASADRIICHSCTGAILIHCAVIKQNSLANLFSLGQSARSGHSRRSGSQFAAWAHHGEIEHVVYSAGFLSSDFLLLSAFDDENKSNCSYGGGRSPPEVRRLLSEVNNTSLTREAKWQFFCQLDGISHFDLSGKISKKQSLLDSRCDTIKEVNHLRQLVEFGVSESLDMPPSLPSRSFRRVALLRLVVLIAKLYRLGSILQNGKESQPGRLRL